MNFSDNMQIYLRLFLWPQVTPTNTHTCNPWGAGNFAANTTLPHSEVTHCHILLDYIIPGMKGLEIESSLIASHAQPRGGKTNSETESAFTCLQQTPHL